MLKFRIISEQINKLITINNETKALTQWCEFYNINYDTVRDRIRQGHWYPLKALITPVSPRKDSVTGVNIRHILYQLWYRLKEQMCDEWRDSFDKFFEWSINNGYSQRYILQRMDDRSYSPTNSKWVKK